MFRSARLKLTLFYLAIFLVFSISVTMTIRVLAEREYVQSNVVERSEMMQQLVLSWLDFNTSRPYVAYLQLQQEEEAKMRQRLNSDLVWINVAALAIGGGLSYWFAGRTLKPIEKAHEAQARFAADASHELRTPLTNMKLENEIFLRQKDFTPAEARELIQSNLEEVQRLENLAANLLALTQYDQTALESKPVAVKELVTAAQQAAQKTLEAKNIKLHRQIKPAKVRGHADSLVQLLAILLDNAVKYGPTGGNVTITGRRRPDYYEFAVQDEGPGIDEADLPHIFERLYRGDKARTGGVGGYGLGLSLARAIATANNAALTASNSPKGGAVFTLQLPLAK